jgi:hypothetical protein
MDVTVFVGIFAELEEKILNIFIDSRVKDKNLEATKKFTVFF